MAWILQNMESILVTLVLATVLTLIALRLVKNRRRGKRLCGGGCDGCANAEACHTRAPEKNQKKGRP